MKLDRRLLALVRSSRLPFYLTITVGFLGGLLTVFQASVLSRIIARVFIAGMDLGQVHVLLGLLLALIFARTATIWAGESLACRFACRLKTELRIRLFSHLQRLGPLSLRPADAEQGDRTGELVNTAVEGIESLDAYFGQYLPQLALAVLTPLTILAFILPLDPLSGLVFLLTAPLIPLFMILIGDLAETLTRRQWTTLSRMSAHFLDVLQGLATLKLFGRSQAQIQVIARVSDRFRQATMGVMRVAFVSALVLELAATLSTAIVAVEISLRLLHGQLSFEQALFILLLAPEFYLPLRMLGFRTHAGMAGATAAGRIFEILEKPPATRDEGTWATEDSISSNLVAPPVICFEEVRFSYPGDRPALDGVSFEIPAGQSVALVGESGTGKSTIASLLLRFLEPRSGRISIAGKPLSGFSPAGWRSQVSWVPQQPYLFNDTIAANIRLARPEASLEQVAAAAQLAGAHEFIQALPQGYKTTIGEHGSRLSGGQRQQLALARAFLKDAPILILDEPTAHLDPEHAAQLEETLERLLARRTALIIAHRLSTIQRAGQIVFLENGVVAGSGAHTDLLAEDGPYRRFLTSFLDRPVQESVSSAGTGPAGSDPYRTSSSPFVMMPRPITDRLDPQKIQSGQDPPLQTPALPGAHHRTGSRFFPYPLTPLFQLLSPFAGRVALSVLLGFLTVSSGVGLMAASAYLLSAAALYPSIAALQVPIVGVRFFGLTRGIFRYLERYVTHDVTLRLLVRLRVWFYTALEPLAPARLSGYGSGDLLSRIVADVSSLENFYVRAIAPPLVAVLVMASMAAYLWGFSPALAATLAVAFLIAGGAMPALIRRLSLQPGRQLIQARAALNATLVDGLQGMADLQAFGAEARQRERVERQGADLSAAQVRQGQIGGFQSAAGHLLAHLALWSVLVLAIPLVRAGQLEAVYLATLALAALASFEAVPPLQLAAQHLESSQEAARRLFAVVNKSTEIPDPVETLPVPRELCLEVRDLKFTYPADISPGPAFRPPAAVRGLSFSLPPGKKIAIVGPSGAGKSTLVNLLSRFLDGYQGEILIGGQELHCYRPDELRKAIAIVPQRTHLFSATISENLLLARPGASQAELARAAQSAHIHDFIQGLPEGYNTWIGEQGLRLSGGQRQRLAIARALLKDAPLLILDEATVNLDILTEIAILESIFTWMKGRSILMITHRLAGMEHMDEILVMHSGLAIERGKHADLLERGGYYRRMWEFQHPGIG